MSEAIEDRRKFPTCTVPCKPIYDELKGMVSQKLFLWLVGSLAFFVIVIQGGFLWTIQKGIGEMKVEQVRAISKLDAVEKRFEDHLKLVEQKMIDF